jgi:excisionase family DNA binding protein
VTTLYTSQEAADILRVHRTTLLIWARKGLIGCYRQGNRVRFSPEHISEYLADSEMPATTVTEVQKPSRNPNRRYRN